MRFEEQVLERFDRRLREVERRGDQVEMGAGRFDRALVRAAAGRTIEAIDDHDGAARAMDLAGYRGAASIAASAGSLLTRLTGDLEGAVRRAEVASEWAPEGTVAVVFAQINRAEAAMDARDWRAAVRAYRAAADVEGEPGLPIVDQVQLDNLAALIESTEGRGYVYARTPTLTGRPAGPGVLDAVQRAILGQAPVDSLEVVRRATCNGGDIIGVVAAAMACAILRLRLGDQPQAAIALAEAGLLCRSLNFRT